MNTALIAAKEVKSAISCSNVSASSSNNLGSHKAIVRLHIPIAGPVKMVRGENSPPRRHNIIPPGARWNPTVLAHRCTIFLCHLDLEI